MDRLGGPFIESQFQGKKTRFTLKWTIKDFKFLRHRTDCLRSPCTTMADLGFPHIKGKWCITVVPAYKETSRSLLAASDVTVTVSVDGLDKDVEIPSEFCLKVLGLDGSVVLRFGTAVDRPVVFSKFNDLSRRQYASRGISHDVVFARHSPFLVDGALVLEAEIGFVLDYKNNVASNINIKTTPPYHLEGLGKHLAALYDSKIGADMVLISSDEKEFIVHRGILAARSPFFQAMFTHDTKEKQSGRCKISDVDGTTLDILLRYMYYSSISRIGNSAEKVLEVANKYQVADLQAFCEMQLGDQVNLKNAAYMVIMADQRNLRQLQAKCMDFIAGVFAEFSAAGGLLEVKRYSPRLMNKVVQHFTEKAAAG